MMPNRQCLSTYYKRHSRQRQFEAFSVNQLVHVFSLRHNVVLGKKTVASTNLVVQAKETVEYCASTRFANWPQ